MNASICHECGSHPDEINRAIAEITRMYKQLAWWRGIAIAQGVVLALLVGHWL